MVQFKFKIYFAPFLLISGNLSISVKGASHKQRAYMTNSAYLFLAEPENICIFAVEK